MLDNPIVYLLAILAGFLTLIYGADRFVHGASTTARHLGVSPLVIGLTIVALGTSAPEVFTSGAAALTGSPEIAIGNVLGSNIANIGLIVGCTALVAPLRLPGSLLREEIPILLLVTFATLLLFLDGVLQWTDGVILLLLLGAFIWRMFHNSAVQRNARLMDDDIEEYLDDVSMAMAVLLLLAGLVLMVFGSHILVWGARNMAYTLGVSELVVGLTIVAVGTSLPELATSIASVRKGHHDLAIGNVVGSIILNLLVVLPVPAFIGATQIERVVLVRDFPAVIFFTVLLSVLTLLLLPAGKPLGKLAGVVFIIFYLAYTVLLFVEKS